MSTKPPSDDLDRDALYSSDPEEADDYELEPLDESVLTAEQRHTQAILESLAGRLDVDEIIREEERRLEARLLDNLMSDLRLKFSIKHLLGTTAVVAILASVAHYDWRASLLLAVLGIVGGLLLYLARKERQHQAVIQEHRRRRRERIQAGLPEEPLAALPTPAELPRESLAQTIASIGSLKEFLVVAAFCSIVLILLVSSLGAEVTATCLGLVALIGFVLQWIGFDMPRFVALVWWVLMVVYVVMCIVLAVSS